MGFRKLFQAAVCCAVLLSTGACSTTPPQVAVEPEPDLQVISVNTPGVTGANCFLQTGAMSYPVAAPGKVMVRKSSAPMDVTCFKGEHMVGNNRVRPTMAGGGYPANVTVAMALQPKSFDLQVTHFQRSFQ